MKSDWTSQAVRTACWIEMGKGLVVRANIPRQAKPDCVLSTLDSACCHILLSMMTWYDAALSFVVQKSLAVL